jgi:F0F1-type ATP synthase delta subunit
MPLSLILQIVIPLVVIFAVIVFVLSKVLGSHTKIAVEKLQKLNEENLRREIDLKRKLDEAEKSYKQKMLDVEQMEKKIVEKAQKEALETRDRIIGKANSEYDEILHEAKQESEQLRMSVKRDCESAILVKASDIIKQTLDTELEGFFHEHFAQRVIDELNSIKSPPDIASYPIVVGSPYPISQELQRKLQLIFKDKFGSKVNITEKIDPSYIAGLHIKIGSLVIDGTLRNKITQALELIKNNI